MLVSLFYDYCMSFGIDMEHLVPHIHNQNGIEESLITSL